MFLLHAQACPLFITPVYLSLSKILCVRNLPSMIILDVPHLSCPTLFAAYFTGFLRFSSTLYFTILPISSRGSGLSRGNCTAPFELL